MQRNEYSSFKKCKNFIIIVILKSLCKTTFRLADICTENLEHDAYLQRRVHIEGLALGDPRTLVGQSLSNEQGGPTSDKALEELFNSWAEEVSLNFVYVQDEKCVFVFKFYICMLVLF